MKDVFKFINSSKIKNLSKLTLQKYTFNKLMKNIILNHF